MTDEYRLDRLNVLLRRKIQNSVNSCFESNLEFWLDDAIIPIMAQIETNPKAITVCINSTVIKISLEVGEDVREKAEGAIPFGW